MTKKTPLSDKQEKFCEFYVIDLNATQAAISAGYSKKTAEQQASRLLSNVKVRAHVQKLREKQQKRCEIDADKVLNEIASVAFARTEDIVCIDNGELSFVEDQDRPERSKVALKKIKVKRRFEDVGEDTHLIEDLEFDMHDKLKALDMLTKHLGICIPKTEVDVTDNTKKETMMELLKSMSPEEKKKMLLELRNK